MLDLFEGSVVALEIVPFNATKTEVLLRGEGAREPLLNYYKTVSFPLKNEKGKLIIYYE